MFDRDIDTRGGTVVVACVAGAFSSNGVVVMGVGRAPMLCLLGEGEPSSSLETMWSSSMESPIMAHRGAVAHCGLSPWGRHPSHSPGREAQATKAVGDKLKALEATACQMLTIGRDSEHR
jgi:hypothetical protein